MLALRLLLCAFVLNSVFLPILSGIYVVVPSTYETNMEGKFLLRFMMLGPIQVCLEGIEKTLRTYVTSLS